jgi:hypothetical protein
MTNDQGGIDVVRRSSFVGNEMSYQSPGRARHRYFKESMALDYACSQQPAYALARRAAIR